MALPQSRLSILNLFPEITDGDIKFADFWRSWVVSQDYKDDAERFDEYLLEEGKRWDELSQEVYNDRRLWWIIPLFNDIEDPFEIYFGKTSSIARQVVKIPDQRNVKRFIDEIRRRRLQFEKV